MILLNSQKDLILKFDEVISVNIATDGKKIMATCIEPMARDKTLAIYSDKKKCQRAFGFFVIALKNNADFFEFPSEDDDRLNTTLISNKGFKAVQTSGKQK